MAKTVVDCAVCGFPLPANNYGELRDCPQCHTSNEIVRAGVSELPTFAPGVAIALAVLTFALGFALGHTRRE